MLLGMLNRAFSQFLLVNYLIQSRANDNEIQSQLSLPAWLYQKVVTNSRRYSLEDTKRALRAILRADCMLKSNSLGPNAIFEEMLPNILATPKRRAA